MIKPLASGLALLTVALALAACGGGRAADRPQASAALRLQVESTAFADGATIPQTYTCDGTDSSPPLTWSEPPAGTQSLALIGDDPDAPAGTWVHWVAYDLPASARSLPEGTPPEERIAGGGVQGHNSWKRLGYGGPCPPKGSVHRYFFKLYAVDTTLNLPPGATKQEVERAMQGHILAEGQLMGRYGR